MNGDRLEITTLRRIARVSGQLLAAERRFFASRDENDLRALRDLKFQLRRLLEQHWQRWGRFENGNDAGP